MTTTTSPSELRLCSCPEPEAEFPQDYPDGMHVHDDPPCRVFHRGKVCTLKQPELPLEVK